MRYVRQEIFIGKKNQDLTREKTVSIIGLGALGSVASELLTRAGIKELILIDRDYVELSNLQRQTIFDENDIGKSKAFVLKEKLNRINKEVKIQSYFDNLDNDNLKLIKSDLILDCTDNFETRFLINDYCVKNKIPFIYSSSIGDSGYVFNIIPGEICFNCVFKEVNGLETCETFGVLNTITHLIASLQVNEALKILMNKEYEKNIIYINLENNELIKIKASKDKSCKVCSKKIFDYLEGRKNRDFIKFCGSSSYLFRGNFDIEKLKQKLNKEKVNFLNNILILDKLTIFKNKVLIKAKDEKEAKSLYSKFIGN